MENKLFVFDRQNIFGWITACLFYLLLYPYFMWEYASIYNWIVLLPLYILLFTHIEKNNEPALVIFFALLLILMSFCNGQNVIGLVFNFLMISLFLVEKEWIFRVYEKFRFLYVTIMALSITSMLLVLAGVPLPVYTLQPLVGSKTYTYLAYPFFVESLHVSDFTRFCGPFDEPGVVGTIGVLLLYIEKFNLKKFGNIVILISGVLSFSLFFYIVLFVFVAYKVLFEKTKKYIKILLLLFLATGSYFIITNETANSLIFERIQWNRDKKSISGDNRAHDDLKYYVKQIRGTSGYYWGVRNKNIENEFIGSASLQNAVLRYGVVVIFLYFIFYALYAKKFLGLKPLWLMYMALLFMLLYNRPSMFSPIHLFLYNMAIFVYSDYFKDFFELSK